ncbi:hypothetical protein EV426DRAFT_252144 [Tirmania nivea]|nr:hypothetical protein EV426DRAFT_252144 [Tirmania nivea]
MVDVSISGNGEVAVVVEWGGERKGRRKVQDGAERPKWYTLQIYPSLDALFPTTSRSPPPSTSIPTSHPTPVSTYPLPLSHAPTSLSSTLTSHALLLQPTPTSASLPHSLHSPPPRDQNQPYPPYPLILTTGDPRHPSLLLHTKDPTTTSTTERQLLPLAPLEGLQDLVRLEADPGAWEVAVVDGGGGVYLFGGRTGGERGEVGVKEVVSKVQALEEGEDVILISASTLLSSASEEGKEIGGEEAEEREKTEISYVEGDAGIQDVALGSSHLLALLDSGEVFGIGRPEEGQLGCGGSSEEGRRREGWVKVEFGKERKVKVEKVWAGAWGSWMLVEEEKELSG